MKVAVAIALELETASAMSSIALLFGFWTSARPMSEASTASTNTKWAVRILASMCVSGGDWAIPCEGLTASAALRVYELRQHKPSKQHA